MDIGAILAKIGFDWQVALANLVNFLIIVVILKIFVFKPIQDIITKRKEAIDKGLKDAEEAKLHLEKAQEERDVLVTQAKIDAESIILESREEGRRVKDRIEELAHIKEVEILRQAEDRAEETHRKALEDVRDEAADMVVNAVKSILVKNMDKQDQDDYLKKATELIKN